MGEGEAKSFTLNLQQPSEPNSGDLGKSCIEYKASDPCA
jgi:hypothetical protein